MAAHSAAALAAHLGVEPPARGAEVVVHRVAAPHEAGPRDVAVLFDDSADAPAAALVVCGPHRELPPDQLALRVADPRTALYDLLDLLHPAASATPRTHPSAVLASPLPGVAVGPLVVVEEGARVGRGTELGAQCYVGPGVVVGRRCRVGPGARLLAGTVLGDDVVVGANSVLGSDGFGYRPAEASGARRPVPQTGRVEIGNGAHIGALSAVDRATVGATVVGLGARVDNLVQVGHNVVIGAHAVLVAQVGLSGSAHIGEGAVLAGQVGVADHRRVGDGATVLGRSAVWSDVPAGAVVLGEPARDRRRELRDRATLRRLAREREQR